MRITFLIGNGFDLNLGLRTQYTDFYKIYTSTDTADDELLSEFKKNILERADAWSNAELAFGKYTQKILDEGRNAEDFCICHEDFCEKLAKYLENQERKINFEELKAEIKTSFAQSISFQNILTGFREETQDYLKSAATYFSDGFEYNFICFNYTRTLDKCVGYVTDAPDSLGQRTHNGRSHQNTIGRLYHVHGFLDTDMVLGVNDESQISAPELFKGFGPEYKKQLIKQQTNEMNEMGIDKKVDALVQNSDLIYIYGMSIGETDALWWQRVISAMRNKSRLHVIIHCYQVPKVSLVRRRVQTFYREQTEKFLSFSNIPQSEKSEFMNRIHIDGNNIFELLKETVTKKAVLNDGLHEENKIENTVMV